MRYLTVSQCSAELLYNVWPPASGVLYTLQRHQCTCIYAGTVIEARNDQGHHKLCHDLLTDVRPDMMWPSQTIEARTSDLADEIFHRQYSLSNKTPRSRITSEHWITDEYSSDSLARLWHYQTRWNRFQLGWAAVEEKHMSLQDQRHTMRDELREMELLPQNCDHRTACYLRIDDTGQCALENGVVPSM